jgi:hypothetical protein
MVEMGSEPGLRVVVKLPAAVLAQAASGRDPNGALLSAMMGGAGASNEDWARLRAEYARWIIVGQPASAARWRLARDYNRGWLRALYAPGPYSRLREWLNSARWGEVMVERLGQPHHRARFDAAFAGEAARLGVAATRAAAGLAAGGRAGFAALWCEAMGSAVSRRRFWAFIRHFGQAQPEAGAGGAWARWMALPQAQLCAPFGAQLGAGGGRGDGE